MRRIAVSLAVTALAATSVLAGVLPAAASHSKAAAHHTTATPRFYYVSLGDSLARGLQPSASGDVETNQGYPDQLFTALQQGNPFLHLIKFGCPGETTTSMIKGGICTYKAGSQLNQAARFLKNHPGHVQLVTIDIGANDLNPCVVFTDPAKIVKCLNKVIPVAVKNLATIMAKLRAASPTPVNIIGMNYYVPELAGWLKGTAAAKSLAQASIALGNAFNGQLTTVYTKFKAPVADVFNAFHTANFKTMVTIPAFGSVPRDVGFICSYTWQCSQFQDEHANRLGYAVIASAFMNKVLPPAAK
jgi:lysophospholipase L1-like esterase